MKSVYKILIEASLIVIAVLLTVFFTKRSISEPAPITITDTIVIDKPTVEYRDSVRTIERIKEIFYSDTVFDTLVFTHTDTLMFLGDWETIREYDERLFDIPSVGVCDIHSVVHLNRLDTISYAFTPYPQRSIVFEASAGLIAVDSYYPTIGLGISSNKMKCQVLGLYSRTNKGLGVLLSYKF